MDAFVLAVVIISAVLCTCQADKPNIVFIIADDLGWNDVGFHGSNQIPTPNIDALATSGLVLHNYYVTPICTPSRSAIMTGKYPIHTGMQHKVIYGNEPRGLPLSEKILPQHLKELGYATHLVGKWHLGSYKKEYLPMSRGFDSHLGYWTGKIDLFDHTTCENGMWGFDFRRGYEVADDLFGKYATDVYSEEAVRIIESHNKSSPLFLMVAHTAVHSGNPYEPLRAPDKTIDKFNHIEDSQRRKFAAMLSKLDESVGIVVESLQKHGLLENSIIIFSTDNGGPAAGFNDNAASNWPLKGVKNTLWEGGVRGAAALWSPLLEKKSRVATQRFHLVDWLPTLMSAIGGNLSAFNNLDGINQWKALSQDLESGRESVVHNIDDKLGSASITVGKWKIHKGTNYGGKFDTWYGPSGRQGAYDIKLLYQERAGAAINQLGLMPDTDTIKQIRLAASVDCKKQETNDCRPLVAPCLFDIEEDPCENYNLANEKPDVLKEMLLELEKVNRTAVPPIDQKLDPRGDPKYWGRMWTNFGDYVPQ